jgi:hypothetical protein
MKQSIVVATMALALCMSGCATYRMSKDVKLLGYDEDASKGKSIGEVSGESCDWKVAGYSFSRPASLDEAVADVRTRTGGLRYLTHVSTENAGFDARIVSKNCIVVKGVAYQ